MTCHPNKPCEHCPNRPNILIGGERPQVKTCSSYGPKKPRIVVIGEAPSVGDVTKNKPFAGESGQVLRSTMLSLGYNLDEEEVYYMNALPCLQKSKTGMDAKQKDKAIQLAISAHRPQFLEEMASLCLDGHKPEIILSLGNAAMWAVTGDYSLKISQNRGVLMTSPFAKIGVITTYHPAFLMRNPKGYKAWRDDFTYMMGLIAGNKKKAPRPHVVKVIPSVKEFIDLTKRLVEFQNKGEQPLYIAGDYETTGFRFVDNDILCLGIATSLDNGHTVHVISDELLADPQAKIVMNKLFKVGEWVWHNGKFDIKFARAKNYSNAKVHQDTMLLNYTLNEQRGIHDLEQVAQDLLGAPNYKDMLEAHFPSNVKKADRHYGMLPRKVLYEYLGYDVANTYQIFEILYPKVMADDLNKKLYNELLIPASEALAKVEMEGLILDVDQLGKNELAVITEMAEQRAIIQKMAAEYGMPDINPNSWQQVGELLYTRMRIAPRNLGTDKKVLIKFDLPIIRALLEFKNRSKRYGTYIKPMKALVQGDGRIHSSFLIHGTATGRLSSKEPNIQNIPRGPLIRSQFGAPEDYVMIEVDLNQAELRSLAIMSGDPTLIEIYTKNEVSIHHITSVAFFGENYTDEQKMRAKAVNFGIVYGREAPSLAEEFDISNSEAQKYIDAWLERYPEAARFIADCRKAPLENKNLMTVFGRRKRATIVSRENQNALQNEAANFPHQATASDIVLKTCALTIDKLKEDYNAKVFNLIHDALLYYVRKDKVLIDSSIKYVQSVMEDVPVQHGLTLVPFLAEAKIGTNWGALKGYDPDKVKSLETFFN